MPLFHPGTAAEPVRATLMVDQPSIVTLSTFPNATCTLAHPDRPDLSIPAYADDHGTVRISVVHTGPQLDTIQLIATCVAEDGRSERIEIALLPNDEPTDLPQVPLLEEDRWGEIPADLQRVAASGLDPLALSDDKLSDLGYPPRPGVDDQVRDRASWHRLADLPYLPTRGSSIRLEHRVSDIRRGILSGLVDDMDMSDIWCGYVLTGGVPSFGWVDGFWKVPELLPDDQQFAETAVWVGIGGNGKGSLIQTGTNSQARRFFGATVSAHYAWHEWYPGGSSRISNVPVAPGDEIYARAWFENPFGKYFLANMTRGYQAFTQDTAPGQPFVGESAEWIVERPSENGVPQPLARFDPINIYLAGGGATNGPSRSPSSKPHVQRLMRNPSTGHVLAIPTLYGNDVHVIFHDQV
jgi:Peptidase A4 family